MKNIVTHEMVEISLRAAERAAEAGSDGLFRFNGASMAGFLVAQHGSAREAYRKCPPNRVYDGVRRYLASLADDEVADTERPGAMMRAGR